MALQAKLNRSVVKLRSSLQLAMLLAIIAFPFMGTDELQAESGSPASRRAADWHGTEGFLTSAKRGNPIRQSSEQKKGQRRASKNSRDVRSTSGRIAQRIGSSVSSRTNTVRPAIDEVIVEQPPAPISGEYDLVPSADGCGDSCGLDGYGGCATCGPGCISGCLGLEVRVEGLLWWTDGFDTPPLATTSPAGTADPNTAGVLGQAGTSILFGDDDLNGGVRGGGRYSVSKRLGPCMAIDASYLHLGRKKEDFSAGGGDNPIVARPFFDVELGQEGSGITAFSNVSSGTLDITATSEFDLFDVTVRRSMCHSCCFRVDLLAGYRYGKLDEDLSVRDQNEALSGLAVGTTFDIRDSFNTESEFHGGQLGLLAELQRNCWSFEFLMKIALGNTKSTVDVNGSSVITPAGGGANNLQGGFLALPSNIGQVTDDELAILPEFGLTVSRPLGCSWQVSAGYSFLYWSRVVRPGDQIDRNLDPRQFPPPVAGNLPAPARRFEYTDFWAQGLRLGLERTW